MRSVPTATWAPRPRRPNQLNPYRGVGTGTGETLEEGTARGHRLDFAARLTSAGTGMRGVLTAAWPGASSGSCSAGVVWPRLASIVLLGVGPVDVPSVSVTVCSCSPYGRHRLQ